MVCMPLPNFRLFLLFLFLLFRGKKRNSVAVFSLSFSSEEGGNARAGGREGRERRDREEKKKRAFVNLANVSPKREARNRPKEEGLEGKKCRIVPNNHIPKKGGGESVHGE